MRSIRSRRWRLAVTAAALCAATAACAQGDAGEARLAPEFTTARPADWLNSPPLRVSQLAGHVALIEVWTFDCYNCWRSIPWLQSVDRRLGPRGLRLVGVHTPEFEREKPRDAVERHLRDYGVTWPVMLDNDAQYWRAIGNRFWPTFYLVDKRGLIRAALAGETHEGDFNAKTIEELIGELLAEPA